MTMQRTLALTAASLAVLVAAQGVESQQGLAFELRGGAAIPLEEVVNEELGTGFGFEGTIRYGFMPHLAAYAGWDWMRFSPDASFAGADMDFEETGYAFGLRFEHPFSEGAPLAGWLRAGATYDHLEIENADGDIVGDSGHGFGYEAGAGIGVELGRLHVTPGVRYRALSRDIEVGAVTTAVDLRYLAVELGFVFAF